MRDPATLMSTQFPDCDSEPIHVPGRIQAYGFLIALDSSWAVTHVSANIREFTGLACEMWWGRAIEDVCDRDAVHMLRNWVAMLNGPDAVQRIFALPLIADRPSFDVAVHYAGETIVIEAEPAVTDEREAASLVRAMAARLKHSSDLAQFFRDGARHVQALTGFNRVMVYRFGVDGHGEVVAEALRNGAESYVGLHYPASDIPKQARALYVRSPFRIIADVAGTVVPIEAAPGIASTPIDQSLSALRAVSPVHIVYLVNMDVAASLSISIIVNGVLWGLFACHHDTARLPSFAYRTAAALFGEIFSMLLEGRLRRDAADHALRDHALAALLVAEMKHDPALLTDASRLGELIFDTVPADGVCVHLEGRVYVNGQTPDARQCAAIAMLLAQRDTPGIFTTDALGTVVAGTRINPGATAGMMAIPLARHADDYLLLFRIEHIHTVRWAGNPEKIGPQKVGKESDNQASVTRAAELSPRTSFAAWAERVRGRSMPFTDPERHAGEAIRIALLEAQLGSPGQAGNGPASLQGDQDLLIAELNHRVRNILALIRGLISQTRSGAETTNGFIAALDERVQSLARAHDQVTSDRWGPARLRDLIDTEASAYRGSRVDCITVEGINILIEPAAFTTLALVFHELMTNAAKYGALSNDGSVLVAWRLGDDGDLLIDWTERGGPPVSPPMRRGFGSTIIERSIPYDLGGAAWVSYPESGFAAEFRIPAICLAGVSESVPDLPPANAVPVNARPLEDCDVLLVEDNMIIALDCADTLMDLGAAHVTTASSIREALAAIDTRDFEFALLDFNLGDETSSAVGDVLAARGIRFAFATGFDGDIQDRGHSNAPVLGKPFGKQQLIPLLLKLGFKTGS